MREKNPPPHPHEHDGRQCPTRQCRELFARMSEYLDKELDETDIQAMEDHLKHSPACRACLASLERTIALCHAIPAPETDEAFSMRLREALIHCAGPFDG